MGIKVILLSLILLAISAVIAKISIYVAQKWGLLNSNKIPSIGGIGIILTWWIAVLMLGFLPNEKIYPLIIITLIILLAGLWDTKKPLSAFSQLLIQIMIATLTVFWADISITHVTNPLGGVIDLHFRSFMGIITVGQFLTMLWIVVLINVINFLDGMDGLAASVTSIGFLAIAFVSLLPQVNDPTTALAAIFACISILGFLFWNYPPSSLILGTTGSWFLGFLISILAAQGASKVATTVVVGAIPVTDALIVVVGRIMRGRSPLRGDFTHLHHRLKRRGLSARIILFLYASITTFLGLAAVLLQTHNKIIFFLIFSILLVIVVGIGSKIARRNSSS